MKKILAIIKKDLKRYFTDPRTLIGLFLPGIVIFCIYTLMGGVLRDSLVSPDKTTYTVYCQNVPEGLSSLLTPDGYDIELKDADGVDAEAIKGEIREGDADIFIKFDADFAAKLGGSEPPEIEIYYSSAVTDSAMMFSIYSSLFDAYEDSLSNMFDVNRGTGYDLATTEDISTTFISMLMPMLILMLLWSGCMMISAESVAGEKERGTIATLLVTPVKRSHIALAKVASLSLTALASSLCSFLGVALSLPSLFVGMGVSMDIYGAGTYAAILAVIVLTVLLFNVILIIISTVSKSIKEATGYSSAAMVAVMLIAVSGMFGDPPSGFLPYLIPVYNSAQCFSALTALAFDPLNFAVTILSDAAFIAVGIWIITKMFGSEKIMFSK